MIKTENLFARFKAIYGGRWTACYSTAESVNLAIAEWSEVVERMNDEQLAQAIAWAKTSCTWPPSMAEFLHAGLGIDEESISDAARNCLTSWQRSHMGEREIEKAVQIRKTRALRGLISKGLMIEPKRSISQLVERP